ncbi:MAG: nitroreductase family protein [Thaumarchaeota archaeon]|nr:nitroreductase family protein [Nitrososphaerota archaeon]
MDTFEAITTKLDVRLFDTKKQVPKDVKLKVLEAGRLTASGMNVQHWRFVLVQDPKSIKKLADDSTTGQWVATANFAIILLTDPKLPFHQLDAGRGLQDMQLAAWNFSVASGIYTGFDSGRMRRDFGIPSTLEPSVVIGFGFPAKKIKGRKNRKSLEEVAYLEKYGNKFETAKI